MFSFESCLVPHTSPCFPFESCLVSYSSLCFTPILVPGWVTREATNRQWFFLHTWCHSLAPTPSSITQLMPSSSPIGPWLSHLSPCYWQRNSPQNVCSFWPKPVFFSFLSLLPRVFFGGLLLGTVFLLPTQGCFARWVVPGLCYLCLTCLPLCSSLDLTTGFCLSLRCTVAVFLPFESFIMNSALTRKLKAITAVLAIVKEIIKTEEHLYYNNPMCISFK